MPAIQTSGYFRRRGWKDFIFIAVAISLWFSTKYWLNPGLRMTDRQKWEVRPRLDSRDTPPNKPQPGESDLLSPCLYLVPPSGLKQPVVSGTVGDCVLLIPDGSRWDLFEIYLVSGYFVPVTTDVYVAGTMPLAFTRTYRTLDDWSDRMKIYLMDVYDPFLLGERDPYSSAEWDLPDVLKIPYKRVSAGTGFADAVFEYSGAMPVFGGSRIAWNGWGWDLSLPDGTTYLTPEAYSSTRPVQSSLVAIFDRDGNELRLTRERNGNLVRVESPNGGWIGIDYSENRITRVAGSSGDRVDYDYDRLNRLRRTTNSEGITREYAYDDHNRLLKVADSKTGAILQVTYDSEGKTVEAAWSGGSSYYLNYALDKGGGVSKAEVIGPQSDLTRVRILDGHYTVEKLRQPEAH